MPKIIISQKREWGARFRVIDLYLDGEILGYMPNGETIEFEVPAGQHTLRAKTGFYSSKVLSFKMFSNDIRSFTIFPDKLLHIFLPIMLLGLGLRQFYSKRIFNYEHTDAVIFPVFLLLSVYSLTIGRKTYLRIKEVI